VNIVSARAPGRADFQSPGGILVRINERYLIDSKGKKVGVLLDIEEYQSLLKELEELESIRAYDAARASGDEATPFEDAVIEIEQNLE
jgi:PHD/YefM family antitoxin component YafN of YafNO toxin-antitoxin module